MAGLIQRADSRQSALLPERLEDWIVKDHLVRDVDLFVEELDLSDIGFVHTIPARDGAA